MLNSSSGAAIYQWLQFLLTKVQVIRFAHVLLHSMLWNIRETSTRLRYCGCKHRSPRHLHQFFALLRSIRQKKNQPQNNPKPDSSSCYRDATGLPLTPETPSVRVRFTTPSPKKLGTVWKMQKRTNQKESFENSIHPVLYRKHMIGCFTLWIEFICENIVIHEGPVGFWRPERNVNLYASRIFLGLSLGRRESRTGAGLTLNSVCFNHGGVLLTL